MSTRDSKSNNTGCALSATGMSSEGKPPDGAMPGRSCPIAINYQQSTKSGPDASIMSLCPMMRNYSAESKEAAILSSTPTDSLRPETPDEDKIDVRHLSLALMKLLFPKVSHCQLHALA